MPRRRALEARRLPHARLETAPTGKMGGDNCAVGNRAYQKNWETTGPGDARWKRALSSMRGWKPRLPAGWAATIARLETAPTRRIGKQQAPETRVGSAPSHPCAVGNRAYRQNWETTGPVSARWKRALSPARGWKPRLPAELGNNSPRRRALEARPLTRTRLQTTPTGRRPFRRFPRIASPHRRLARLSAPLPV